MTEKRKGGPSLALMLAQALASESRDAVRDQMSKAEIRALWRSIQQTGRRYWIKKARRVLERLRVLGPNNPDETRKNG